VLVVKLLRTALEAEMMYSIFKIVHIAAFAGLFMALGALAFHGINGGDKESNKARVLTLATHGAMLLVMFITGFGMLGVLKLSMVAPWVIVKLVLFLALGGLGALIQKKASAGLVFWIMLPLLGALGAAMAILKPGA